MEKNGKVLGIPYDFRSPTLSRLRERLWNPDDSRIFTPRFYGVGWSLNFATLKERSTPGFVVAVGAALLIYGNGLRRLWIRLRSLRRGRRDKG
ncbi:MAG: DUF5808 domain-containing protein [Actinomycetota bacterium]|nr:DUF5808 domain-containing protein [Actinomycetota bacterium]